MGDETAEREDRLLAEFETAHAPVRQRDQEDFLLQQAEPPAPQPPAPVVAQQPFAPAQQEGASQPQQTGPRLAYKVERLTDAELQKLGLAPCRNERLRQLLQVAATREALDVKRDTAVSLYRYYGRYSYSQEQQMHSAIAEMLQLPEAAKDPMAFVVQFCVQFGKGLNNLEADPSTCRKISVYFTELNAVLRSRGWMTAQQALFQVTLHVNPLVLGFFRPGQEAPASVAKRIRDVLDATNEDTDFIVRAHYLFNYLALRADSTLNFNTLVSAALEENLARVQDPTLQEQQRADLAAQLFLQLGALMSMFKAERDWLDDDAKDGYAPDESLYKAAVATLEGLCKVTKDDAISKKTQLGFF